MNKNKLKNVNYIGIITTIAVTLFFLWGIKECFTRNDWPPTLSSRQIRANEIATFKNLNLIITAQNEYIKQDRDGDSIKTYAPFLVQLWRTISIDGEYLDINLLDKNIASAMGITHAFKGYYYTDCRFRKNENEEYINLDYEKEWIVSATPDNFEKTGNLVFLVNQTGDIFAKNISYPSAFSNTLLNEGWVLIKTVKELKEYQKQIISKE